MSKPPISTVRGFTLVEVILAFLLMLLFVGALVQTMAVQSTTQLYATVKDHLVAQNRILGNYLSSSQGADDTSPLFPAPQGTTDSPYALGWGNLGFVDGMNAKTGELLSASAPVIISTVQDRNGLITTITSRTSDIAPLLAVSWSEFKSTMNLTDAATWDSLLQGMSWSDFGKEPTGTLQLNWANLSIAYGVTCLPATTEPDNKTCIALVNQTIRTGYATGVLPLQTGSDDKTYPAYIGGWFPGVRARTTPLGTRNVNSEQLQYGIRIYREVVPTDYGQGYSVQFRVWLKFFAAKAVNGGTGTNQVESLWEGRRPIVVETIYQKR